MKTLKTVFSKVQKGEKLKLAFGTNKNIYPCVVRGRGVNPIGKDCVKIWVPVLNQEFLLEEAQYSTFCF